MKVNLTSEDLIKFEEDVCQWFADKKVKAPVHLDNGNEKQLIKVFENLVEEDDWIMCSWRSHYKSLLKGVPYEDMKKAICEGKSISLCFPNQRVISSAIVGGILPIAVGTAMGIKLRRDHDRRDPRPAQPARDGAGLGAAEEAQEEDVTAPALRVSRGKALSNGRPPVVSMVRGRSPVRPRVVSMIEDRGRVRPRVVSR
jgi:hypothetical protein